MKLQVTVLVMTLMAGSAAAQGYGTYAPVSGNPPKPLSAYGSRQSSPASSSPRTYGPAATPTAPGFRPYKPFAGESVYGRPGSAPAGAKPCQTSVYVNSCDRR